MKTTNENSHRSTVKRLIAALAGALAIATTLSFNAAPASAAYYPVGADRMNFNTSNNTATAYAEVRWYRDDRLLLPAVYRGEYRPGSVVRLNRSGCVYARITWHTVTGTASWPPSASGSTTSDGWYRRCGRAGTSISLAGQAYASSSLYKTCLNIGYSPSINTPRSYQSTDCAWS